MVGKHWRAGREKMYTAFNWPVNMRVNVYGNVGGTVYGGNPHRYKG